MKPMSDLNSPCITHSLRPLLALRSVALSQLADVTLHGHRRFRRGRSWVRSLLQCRVHCGEVHHNP